MFAFFTRKIYSARFDELGGRHIVVRIFSRPLRSLRQARGAGERRDAGSIFQHADRRDGVVRPAAGAGDSSGIIAAFTGHRRADVETTSATAAKIRHRRRVVDRHLLRAQTSAALARRTHPRNESAADLVWRDSNFGRASNV